jgi:hypothetical protein
VHSAAGNCTTPTTNSPLAARRKLRGACKFTSCIAAWPATCTLNESMKLRIATFLTLIVLAGCASGGGHAGPQVSMPISIDNNLIPPASLTIYLVPQSGIERNLGTVVGSGHHVLHYRGLPLSGTYQLYARADNRAMASNPIVLDENVTAIDWDLRRNYINLTVRE